MMSKGMKTIRELNRMDESAFFLKGFTKRITELLNTNLVFSGEKRIKVKSSISLKLLTIIFAGIILFAVLLTAASSAFIRSTFERLYEEKLTGPGRTLLAQYRDASQYSRYVDILVNRNTFIEDSKRYLENRNMLEVYEKKEPPYPKEYEALKASMLEYTNSIDELKDAKYNALFRSLLEIQQSSGVESLYILADIGIEDGYVFLFNTFYQGYTGVILHDDFGTVAPKTYYPWIEKVYETGETQYVIDRPERDRQGKVSHSFTPITDGYGHIVAIIGIDINLESIGRQMNDFMTFSIIIAVSISALIIILMLIMLQRIIIQPVKNLTDISTEIANGNVTVKVSNDILSRNDEMGVLGNSYEVMRNALENLVSNNEMLLGKIITGKIDIRGDSTKFDGLFAQLIDKMNDTLDVIGLYFDSIPASFAIMEPGYNIVFSNSNFKTTFSSLSSEEFLRVLLDEEDDYESLKKNFAEKINEGQYECLRWLTTEGENRCYSFICSKVSQGESQSGAVIVISDSTELVKAKDNALLASKAKSEFLSRVSHELRTPLNAIMSLAKLGLNDKELDVSLERFDKIVSSSGHLSNIINDVLEMSRMESGKTEIRYAPMDIDALVNECTSMLQLRAKENNNELTTFVDSKIPALVIGDEFRIKQILINLLSNSSKFTENGTISMVATCLKSSKDECTVRFSVTDTGIGMSEDFLKKIFTPFEQEDSFLSRRYEGSGLGLSISNNLVGLMGGKMTVTSELRHGSRFVFTLTFKIASGENNELNETEDIEDENLSIEGKRLLVVDDVEINRAIVIELLSGNNLIIEEAADGEEALAKYLNSEIGYYDCILMDIQMPKMDGYKTTKAIRETNRDDNNVPVVAMTANALKEDIEHTYECGMNDHLAKPIDFDLCIKTVKKYCNLIKVNERSK